MNYFGLLLILFFTSLKALSTNYYVNPINGNDSSNGTTVNTAFRSLSRIDNLNLQPGDTVFFMQGTYSRPGQTLLTINESGTAANPITFTNYQNDTPVFEFDSWTGIDVVGGSSYLVFDGLTIKGARTKVNLEDAINQPGGCVAEFEGNPEGLFNGTGLLIVGPNLLWSNSATNSVPHHITVNNCEIFDCTSSGVAFQQADYVTVTNNKIYNNCWYTTYGTSGINFYQFVNTDGTTGFHNIVSNNLMYGNQLLVRQIAGGCAFHDGNGFIIDDFDHIQTGNYQDPSAGYEAYSAKTLITNNVSVENGGSGLHFFLSSNCYIYNNTVANNAFQNDGDNSNGELRIGNCSNFEVKNNIFKSEYTVHATSGNSNIDYAYNYQFGPDIASEFENCENCIESVEIEFLNTDIDNSLPYITAVDGIFADAGLTIEEVTGDYNHRLRPNGEGYDIGGHELYVEALCIETTWYADADNDGLGNINDSIEACDQPRGYVAESGDLCDGDANKTEPGNCGCGIVETGCGNPDDLCNSPEYNESTVYSDAGTTVLFNGFIYENLWHTQGDLPPNGGPWELVQICDGPTTDCSTISQWSASEIYAATGSQVVFNGQVYQNRYYIAGGEPGSDAAWQLVGVCTANTINTTTVSFEISLFSLDGNLIETTTSTSASTESMDLEALDSGIYIINSINTTTGDRTFEKISK